MDNMQIRPARPEDGDIVLPFCQDTWEWGDYIDRVWDEWLVEQSGRLLTATVNDRPVGIVNMRMVSETDAWLEGLRVDPSYRRQGIAHELCLAALAEAMRRGAMYARMAIEAENEPSIHTAEKIHMRQVAAFALYKAPPLTPREQSSFFGQAQVSLATAVDLDDIIDYLNISNVFPAVGGLYYVSFTAREITESFLQEKIASQQIYLLRRWDRIDGLAITEPRIERGEQRLSVGYIDGTMIESISLIAHDLRHRLPTLGLDVVRIYAPDLVLVHDALGGLGYEGDSTIFYTFERGLE